MPASKRKVRTIVAVHANPGIAQAYESELATLLREMQFDLTLALSPVVSGGSPLATDAAPSVSRIDGILKRWGDKWRARFDKLAPTIAKRFAGKNFQTTESAMRAALRDAGFTVKFKPTRKSLEAFRATVADNVGLIKNLQSEHYNRIQQDVWASVRKGADMAALSRKLQDSYGITEKRAALISRDQNNKAKAVIENTRRRQLGITEAIWQHSSGGREPRPSHVAMNGKVFDLAKGMWDPDEGEFIFPGELINCRCTSRAIIPGIEDTP